MYGTIARLRLKPGMEERFRALEMENAEDISGFVFAHMYRLDAGANEYYLVIGFENRETYVQNAESPEQHERYLRYRELLEDEPEWHDGEIAFSFEQ